MSEAKEPLTPQQPQGAPDGPAEPVPQQHVQSDDVATQALAEALHSSFKIVKVLMVVLVAVFFGSGMFTVEPNEVAVKLRFGQPVGTGPARLLGPGWHWAWPYPIDEVVKIPVGQTHTVTSTSGWYATTPDMEAAGQEPPPRPSMMPGVDGYTLTGDGNIIHVRATLTYRITDPLSYAFNYANASNMLQHVLDNSIHSAAARFNADDALYRNVVGFQETVVNRVVSEVDRLKLGVTLEPREVRTSAPLDVRASFDEVLTAQQQARGKISEAEAYALALTNQAVAEASAIINNGMTSSNQIVQSVAAEAKYFEDQLPYYLSNPDLFTQRLRTEALGRVLTNAQDKYFLPPVMSGAPRELRLQLSREPQKSKLQSFITEGR